MIYKNKINWEKKKTKSIKKLNIRFAMEPQGNFIIN